MNNPNDRETYHSENKQESYTDANGDTRTHVQRTTETVNNAGNPNSYGSGYVTGRDSERRYQQANLADRDNTNTANGLLVGVILTSLVTLAVAGVWYFNQQDKTPVQNAAPVLVPVPSSASPSPAASQSPQPRTTIIERTREVPVLIPQQPAPSPSASSQPNINNITVPSQQPAAQKAPSASPSPTTKSEQSPTSNSSAQDHRSDAPKKAPVSGADQSNTNSNNGSSSSGDNNTGGSAQ
jgi:hypothetical protein